MARSRGRSSGGLSRPAPKLSKSPTPAPSPAKAPVPQQSGPTTGGLGSVVADGMAFGVGSAVAHRAVDGMMGPRVVRHETVASAAPAAANVDSCVGQFKAFEDCLNNSANDISRCQLYMDMLTECRKVGSASHSFMA